MHVSTLINEYLAPVQPDDCRAVNEARLLAALKDSGPVVHRAEVFSLDASGKLAREKRPVAKVRDNEDSPERDPTDEELAKAWGVKVAGETEVGQSANQPAPAPAEKPAEPEHTT